MCVSLGIYKYTYIYIHRALPIKVLVIYTCIANVRYAPFSSAVKKGLEKLKQIFVQEDPVSSLSHHLRK